MAGEPRACILIVEDAEEIASTMAELLGGAGYEVVCAANGRDALHHLRTAGALPGLILLDLMMPDMDGHEFRSAQTSDPRLAHIPVLLMSAGGDIVASARELGARGYLKKPFKDIDSILDAVSRCVSGGPDRTDEGR